MIRIRGLRPDAAGANPDMGANFFSRQLVRCDLCIFLFLGGPKRPVKSPRALLCGPEEHENWLDDFPPKTLNHVRCQILEFFLDFA
jgi:hypothetical protein